MLAQIELVNAIFEEFVMTFNNFFRDIQNRKCMRIALNNFLRFVVPIIRVSELHRDPLSSVI
jgi:hypothetical protein